jgi:hypothetical protein
MKAIPIFISILVFIIVIIVTVFTIFYFNKPKPSPTPGPKPGPIDCNVKSAMVFSDVKQGKKCNLKKGSSFPAYVIILRHCDRGYPDKNKDNGSSCNDIDVNKCAGCAHLEPEGGCSSNICSNVGIKRSWNLGKWVNCFATTNNKSVSAVFGQVFEPGKSNQRPTTTGSIVYQSLLLNKNLKTDICYSQFYKGKYDDIADALSDDSLKDSIVVIAWDHGDIPGLTRFITGKTKGTNVPYFSDCCFDQAIVISNDKNIVGYDTQTLSENDVCGTPCQSSKKIFGNCTFNTFGNPDVCVQWS